VPEDQQTSKYFSNISKVRKIVENGRKIAFLTIFGRFLTVFYLFEAFF